MEVSCGAASDFVQPAAAAALAVSGLVCLSVVRKGREFGLFFREGDFLKCGGHLGDLGQLGDVVNNWGVTDAA